MVGFFCVIGKNIRVQIVLDIGPYKECFSGALVSKDLALMGQFFQFALAGRFNIQRFFRIILAHEAVPEPKIHPWPKCVTAMFDNFVGIESR